jgi:hypothetical protein
MGTIVLGSRTSGSFIPSSVNKVGASPSSVSTRLYSVYVAEVPADVGALNASIVDVLLDGGNLNFNVISYLVILLFSACSTLTCSFKSFPPAFNSVISVKLLPLPQPPVRSAQTHGRTQAPREPPN